MLHPHVCASSTARCCSRRASTDEIDHTRSPTLSVARDSTVSLHPVTRSSSPFTPAARSVRDPSVNRSPFLDACCSVPSTHRVRLWSIRSVVALLEHVRAVEFARAWGCGRRAWDIRVRWPRPFVQGDATDDGAAHGDSEPPGSPSAPSGRATASPWRPATRRDRARSARPGPEAPRGAGRSPRSSAPEP